LEPATVTTEILIGDEMIRLGQLLKLAGLVGSGGEARAVLTSGRVTVNGVAEGRRGRQLHDGDVVTLDETRVRVRTGACP
jgi:ribosome-associated protein